MNHFKLLDCTLRGGYVNDWKFGHNTLVNVFERITGAGVDFIEVGFLDQRRPFDIDRSIMPSTECMERIYGGLNRHLTEVVGMIDYGTCGLERIQPAAESFLDGIRVIFKKHIKREALEFCRGLKELGYKVFTQAVSITSYDDAELMELIGLVNEVRPYAVSIVDTYGLLHKNSLLHYYEMMNEHLDPGIGIGYHSHNNFQLGYANCIELMSRHGDNPRLLLMDGSIFGMGKGAGNAPVELLATYMNENYGKRYDISQILEAIDVNILDIYRRSPWGYSMKFFIAASNDCHPNYVSYLLDKKTLSVKAVDEILKMLADEKNCFTTRSISNSSTSITRSMRAMMRRIMRGEELLGGRDVLVVGPGATLNTERERIEEYIRRARPVVVAINFIPEGIATDYLF